MLLLQFIFCYSCSPAPVLFMTGIHSFSNGSLKGVTNALVGLLTPCLGWVFEHGQVGFRAFEATVAKCLVKGNQRTIVGQIFFFFMCGAWQLYLLLLLLLSLVLTWDAGRTLSINLRSVCTSQTSGGSCFICKHIVWVLRHVGCGWFKF